MNLVVRTDASTRIGIGHLVRCLSLARYARERGARVVFVTRSGSGACMRRVEDQNFPLYSLPIDPEADEAEDAALTAEIVAKERADVIVVDNYALGAPWEGTLRPSVRSLVAIDDTGRAHDCDVLIDHNWIDGQSGRYEGRLPRNCMQLLGPTYALLGPEFAVLHSTTPARTTPPRRVLVAFGGSDPTNETVKALRALSLRQFSGMAVDVVIGDLHPARDEVLAAAGDRGRVTLHVQLPSLAPVIVNADFGLGAAGGTTWERLCLGLPSAVVAAAENQVPAARALSAAGYLQWLGMSADTSADTYAAALSNPHRPRVGLPQLVDGLGVQRCVDAIFGFAMRKQSRA